MIFVWQLKMIFDGIKIKNHPQKQRHTLGKSGLKRQR
jgi:hypothetical protein